MEPEHLDEKTTKLDHLIEQVAVIGSFIRDNNQEKAWEEPRKEYDQNLNTLADIALGNKKLTKNQRELVKNAIDFSAEKYMLRKRDRGELFFQHALRVASKINKLNGDLETTIAGLLHDVIEENPKYQTLKEEYRKKEETIIALIQQINEKGNDQRTEEQLSTLQHEQQKVINKYHAFKASNLKSIKDLINKKSKELKIKINAENIAETVNKLTKNFYDYYYNYQQRMFISEKYGSKNPEKEELRSALRIFVAKGCDRLDNIETMERLEEGNPYGFSTQKRLHAIYKNLTTINRMRNFLTDYNPQLKQHNLRAQRKVAHELFYKLVDATLKQVREDRQHLEQYHTGQNQDQMLPEEQKKYETLITQWQVPETIIILPETTTVEPQLEEFYKVLQKYDKWLHYTKQGLKENRENFTQQYIDCLTIEKVLNEFKKVKTYTIKGYISQKEKYENGNN